MSWSAISARTASPRCCPAARPGSWRATQSGSGPGGWGTRQARARLVEQVLVLLEQLAEGRPHGPRHRGRALGRPLDRDLLAFLIRDRAGPGRPADRRDLPLRRAAPLPYRSGRCWRNSTASAGSPDGPRHCVRAGRRASMSGCWATSRMRASWMPCTGAPRATRCSWRRCSARASSVYGLPESLREPADGRGTAAAEEHPGAGPGHGARPQYRAGYALLAASTGLDDAGLTQHCGLRSRQTCC